MLINNNNSNGKPELIKNLFKLSLSLSLCGEPFLRQCAGIRTQFFSLLHYLFSYIITLKAINIMRTYNIETLANCCGESVYIISNDLPFVDLDFVYALNERSANTHMCV